jgi:hypothetical protein
MDPVTKITPSEIASICGRLREDVKQNGSGNVRYWIARDIAKLAEGNIHLVQIQDHVIEKVVGTMVRSGEFVFYERKKEHGYDYMIHRNPSFDLNENLKATNLSVQSLNLLFKITNAITVLIAAVTCFYIASQFYHDVQKDKAVQATQIAPKSTIK